MYLHEMNRTGAFDVNTEQRSNIILVIIVLMNS